MSVSTGGLCRHSGEGARASTPTWPVWSHKGSPWKEWANEVAVRAASCRLPSPCPPTLWSDEEPLLTGERVLPPPHTPPPVRVPGGVFGAGLNRPCVV